MRLERAQAAIEEARMARDEAGCSTRCRGRVALGRGALNRYAEATETGIALLDRELIAARITR